MKNAKVMTLLLSAAVLAGIPFPVQAEEEYVAKNRIAQDVAYLDDGQKYHLLDVYGDADAGEAQPLIIEIHGGGLVFNYKETNEEHSDYFADYGFAVVTPNYTLMPDGDYKTAVQDFFSVFEWVTENADMYHYDLDQIYLTGDSAGGYYVSLIAAILNTESLQEYYEVTPPEGFAVKGYAVTCPMADQAAVAEAYETGEGVNSFFASKIGGEILENEEIMKMADLFQVIDPKTYPEIFILTTPEDSSYYADSVKFEAFLTENDIPHKYTEYNGSENSLMHVFNVSNVSWTESQEANQDILDYFRSLG